MPTPESLDALGRSLGIQFGKYNTATMIFYKNANAQKIINFALSRQGHEYQFPYTLNPFSPYPLNFSDTFAADALAAGMK